MRADIVQAVTSTISAGVLTMFAYFGRRFYKSLTSHSDEHTFLMTQVKDNAAAIKRILDHLQIKG